MAYVFIIPGGVYPGLKAVSSDTAFSICRKPICNFIYGKSKPVCIYGYKKLMGGYRWKQG